MGKSQQYDKVPESYQMANLPGNGGTAVILTPQAGTGSETKTHTTTLQKFWFGGRRVNLKRLQYIVTTVQTGAGNNLTLDLYVGTTSKATLALTTETAGVAGLSSSDINEAVESTDYIRVIAKATTTASDQNTAIGTLHITYEELFAQ
jgi:hypothetical protein